MISPSDHSKGDGSVLRTRALADAPLISTRVQDGSGWLPGKATFIPPSASNRLFIQWILLGSTRHIGSLSILNWPLVYMLRLHCKGLIGLSSSAVRSSSSAWHVASRALRRALRCLWEAQLGFESRLAARSQVASGGGTVELQEEQRKELQGGSVLSLDLFGVDVD